MSVPEALESSESLMIQDWRLDLSTDELEAEGTGEKIVGKVQEKIGPAKEVLGN